MSVEEEVELRDLVAQTLESNGCLAKIRAQLRASIFLALDEDNVISSKQPLMNNRIKSQLSSVEGKTMFCIVREFLEFFDLYCTISVYDAETYLGSAYQFEGREKLIENLGLENDEDSTLPILLQLIKFAQKKINGIDINVSVNGSQSQSDKSVSEESESGNSLKTEPSYPENTESTCPKDIILNSTFDIGNNMVLLNGEQNDSNDNSNGKEIKLDSTYIKKDVKGTSVSDEHSTSNEDSIALNDVKVSEITNGINEDHLKYNDKPKSSQKSDKLKSKINLSCLADLPPIQMNKSRGTDILPSLYTKEFKEKSNLRELDKLFDMEVEYEEDFMCSGDELSLKSDYSKDENLKVNLIDEIKSSTKPSKIPIISDSNKPFFKAHINSNHKSKDNVANHEGKVDSGSSSSISEMIDVSVSE